MDGIKMGNSLLTLHPYKFLAWLMFAPLLSLFPHKLVVLGACFGSSSGLLGRLFPGWWLGFIRRDRP